MEIISSEPSVIDLYIKSKPVEIQPMLCEICSLIRKTAPEAAEKISWAMPTFVLHGNLVHFSAEKRHIGFHPGTSAVESFAPELDGYKFSKGTIQFPYSKPLPHDLIRRIVLFRAHEQQRRAEEKAVQKKAD